MQIKHLIISLLSMGILLQCSSEKKDISLHIIHTDHIVDLTHTLTPNFPFIPVKKLTYPFELIPMATILNNGVEANSWKIHEHLGTHIDAPNHFIEDGMSVDELELKDLIVPVVVIDIEKKASLDYDTELTIEDIQTFEKRHGQIPSHACVMMYSGWEKRLQDSSFVGLDTNLVKHYPGFSKDAIHFLIDKRNIAGLGVDVLSFDRGLDENYTGHKILFSAGKWGVECVANLAVLPAIGATIIVGAPKVGKATGGFSRIIAVW